MDIRKHFKLLEEIIYFDNSAGTLKPTQVVDAISNFYNNFPINPHSVESSKGVHVANVVNETRKLVSELINAAENEVIFSSGTTDSINKFARMADCFVKEGDEILLSMYNHTSNVIPWIKLSERTGAKIIIEKDLIASINKKTKIVSYAQENNTFFQRIDHNLLYEKVKSCNAILVNDAAQAITHHEVDLDTSDVIAFSANKIFGPTGIGILAIKQELLSLLEPSTFGGGAVSNLSKDNYGYKEGFQKFEPGTPNTAGIFGLNAAIKFFNEFNDMTYLKRLSIYAFDKLSKIDGVNLLSERDDLVILFNYKNIHPQDIVSYLGHRNIILRSGDHCGKIIHQEDGIKASIRISLAIYNTREEIDKFIEVFSTGGDFLDI